MLKLKVVSSLVLTVQPIMHLVVALCLVFGPKYFKKLFEFFRGWSFPSSKSVINFLEDNVDFKLVFFRVLEMKYSLSIQDY
jgi:hypothetical protein